MRRPSMAETKKNRDLSSSNINPITIYRLICAVLGWAAELAGRGGVNNAPWPGWREWSRSQLNVIWAAGGGQCGLLCWRGSSASSSAQCPSDCPLPSTLQPHAAARALTALELHLDGRPQQAYFNDTSIRIVMTCLIFYEDRLHRPGADTLQP